MDKKEFFRKIRPVLILTLFEIILISVLFSFLYGKISGKGIDSSAIPYDDILSSYDSIFSDGNGTAPDIATYVPQPTLPTPTVSATAGNFATPVAVTTKTPAPPVTAEPTSAVTALPTDKPTMVPTATPNNEPVSMNYYQFNFLSNSFSSLKTQGTGLNINSGIFGDNNRDSVVIEGIEYVNGKKVIKDVTYGTLYITNSYVPMSINIVDLMKTPLKIKQSNDSKPSILIYHTHTSEAYCVEENDKYDINDTTSTDTTKTVVSMGEIVAEVLGQKNISAIHNKTYHDQGYDYNIAYDLGSQTVKDELAVNKDIQLVIDIHRDSASSSSSKYGPTVSKDGIDYAPLMFVVGLDYNESDQRVESLNPYWEENIKLTMLMIEKLEERVPGITRGISLRKTQYSQNLCQNSLLVEMGFDGNLVEEAAASSRLFAEVIAEIYS